MNYLLLLVQKTYLTGFLNGIILLSISQHYFEFKLFSFLEMTLQPVYSVHVGVLQELVLHADKEKEPY